MIKRIAKLVLLIQKPDTQYMFVVEKKEELDKI